LHAVKLFDGQGRIIGENRRNFQEAGVFKRVFLFFLTNVLVMLTLGLIFSLLSSLTPLGAWMNAQGMNAGGLMVICLFWGMGGSIISLLMSRWIAKVSTGAEILDPATARGDEAWLLGVVQRLAEGAGITRMPQVGVYPSAELNAFATGPTKNRAFVAVSEGLLARMSKDEIEGVLGHEMSHVANGDMVTMTLVQGVVNAFVMFLSWILTLVITQALRGRDDRREGMGDFFLRMMIHNMVQMAMMFVAFALVIAPFSRWREFRADAGGAERAGRDKMIGALQALLGYRNQKAESEATAQAPALAAFKISGNWNSIMSTHPPLEERIARLKGS
jgi:heat shock protein HtpX